MGLQDGYEYDRAEPSAGVTAVQRPAPSVSTTFGRVRPDRAFGRRRRKGPTSTFTPTYIGILAI